MLSYSTSVFIPLCLCSFHFHQTIKCQLIIVVNKVLNIEAAKTIQTALLHGGFKSSKDNFTYQDASEFESMLKLAGPKFSKYVTMLNSGVPQGAVEVTMKRNGDYLSSLDVGANPWAKSSKNEYETVSDNKTNVMSIEAANQITQAVNINTIITTASLALILGLIIGMILGVTFSSKFHGPL